MDLMDTVPTRNRAWSLRQSDTGLCNIINHSTKSTLSRRDALCKKKHRKHKPKPNKRRSKKHPHITINTTVGCEPTIPRRERSRSRPRLSQAKLFQLDDKEINAKRKKKKEFLVHRSKMKERRQSQPLDLALTATKPIKRDHKRKRLSYIKEYAPCKPSTTKKQHRSIKNGKKRKRKRRSTKSDAMYQIKTQHNDPSERDKLQKRNPFAHHRKKAKKKMTALTETPPTLATKTDTNSNTNPNTKPFRYKRRKKRKRAHTGSHGIDLNEVNQFIKEHSQSTHPPQLSNHRSYSKNDTKSHTQKTKAKSKTKRKKSKAKAKPKHNDDSLHRAPAKILDHTRYYRSKRKKRYKSYNGLLSEENDRKISNMYAKYKGSTPSPQPTPPKLSFELEDDTSSVSHSSTAYATDSDIEIVTFSPQTRGRSKSEFQKPTVCIQYSPRINEAVFIGYRASPGPTYRFRGKGKRGTDGLHAPAKPEDYLLQRTPSPPEDKFTFQHIKSKYKPHRIQWSTRTGFTDSELEDEEDIYARTDSVPWSESKQSDEDEPSISTSIREHNSAHQRAKTMQINRLLANLLSDGEETTEEEEESQPFKIIIDEMPHDKKGARNGGGNDIFNRQLSALSSSPTSDDENDDELLFDIESFVDSLTKKRAKLERSDDMESPYVSD